MGVFSKLFGGTPIKQNYRNWYDLSSWVATTIDAVIREKGFSHLDNPDAVILLTKNFEVFFNPTSVNRGGNVLAVVSPMAIEGFGDVKHLFGYVIDPSLSPGEMQILAKNKIEMIAGHGQMVVDFLAMAIVSEFSQQSPEEFKGLPLTRR